MCIKSKSFKIILFTHAAGGAGANPDFKVMGMIEGFLFGLDIFNSRIFFGRKVWQVFFLGDLIEVPGGYSGFQVTGMIKGFFWV